MKKKEIITDAGEEKTEGKVSKAQRAANEKWKQKNITKSRIYIYRSTAKRFIKEFADLDDIKEIKELASERENLLKK